MMYNSSIILFFHVRKVKYLCDEIKYQTSFIMCLSLLIYIYLISLKYWKKLKITYKLVKKVNQNLQEQLIQENISRFNFWSESIVRSWRSTLISIQEELALYLIHWLNGVVRYMLHGFIFWRVVGRWHRSCICEWLIFLESKGIDVWCSPKGWERDHLVIQFA